MGGTIKPKQTVINDTLLNNLLTNPPKKGKLEERKVLYFDSSGGAGHKQVATALGATNETRHDILMDFCGKAIGGMAVKTWNKAKKAGNVEKQYRLIKQQQLGDKFLGIIVFFKTLILLFKQRPDRIKNTQAMCLGGICAAMKFYNFLTRRKGDDKVKMEIWMTDLPTDKATHFFNPIKRLSKSDKELVELIAPQPAVPEGMTEEGFWSHYCGLSRDQVRTLAPSDLPVRQDFKEVDSKEFAPGLATEVPFKLDHALPRDVNQAARQAHAVEVAELLSGTSDKVVTIDKQNSKYSLRLGEGDFLWPVVIGSQPPREAIMGYIQLFIEAAKEKNQPDRQFVMVPFCGRHNLGKDTLFKDVCEMIKRQRAEGKIPENVHIVPSPFQDAETISKVSYRADTLTTGAGGSTSFEHLAMNDKLGGKQTPLIHSEAPSPERLALLLEKGPKSKEGNIVGLSLKDNIRFHKAMKHAQLRASQNGRRLVSNDKIAKDFFARNTDEILRSGLPVWERGNGESLEQKVGAKIVSQHTIKGHLVAAMG